MEIRVDGLRVDIEHPIDISRPLWFDGPQPEAFHLPRAKAEPVRVGEFVGDVRQGGSCRCDVITMVPHGNGTHTECLAHIDAAAPLLREALHDSLMWATLLTVTPCDGRIEAPPVDTPALVVRTLPNATEKQWAVTSGAGPPFVSETAAAAWAAAGIRHLILDVPSADPESDGGRLAAHRAFFAGRADATITELAYVPSNIPDGPYLLNLQAAPFMLDAAPSRPLLYRIHA
ncbi:MAG TPA: cyclase family protein [Candidatus Xenobia bacterium]